MGPVLFPATAVTVRETAGDQTSAGNSTKAVNVTLKPQAAGGGPLQAGVAGRHALRMCSASAAAGGPGVHSR